MIGQIRMGRAYLNFNFTFTVCLVAVGSVTPSLNEVPGAGTPGKLNVCRQDSFLCDGEICARV